MPDRFTPEEQEWADQSTLEEERDVFKQRCEAMQLQHTQLQAQLAQHKILYENATAEKDMLANQYSRQLAESEYSKTEVQRELHSYKCQFRAQVSSLSADDHDEVQLLESQLSLVKGERSVLTKQRDLFATELSSLVAKYEKQIALDADKDETLALLQTKLTSANGQISQLQAQMSSMASQRDNSELQLMKRHLEEMNARLERSERRNTESAQLLVAQQQASAREAAARKGQAATLAAAASSAVASAAALAASSAATSSSTATSLAQATEKASKKRKEREAQLKLASTPIEKEETHEAAEVQEDEERAQKKKAKKTERKEKQAEKEEEEDEDAEKENEKAARRKEKKAERQAAREAERLADEAEVAAAEAKKTDELKKAKQQRKKKVDTIDPLAAADEWMGDEEVSSLASKWNVKVGAPSQPPAVPSRSTVTRVTGLTRLALSPIARASDEPVGGLSGRDLSAHLALSEAALDAFASEAANSSGLNDSTCSIDSVTGERRRKLFPAKRNGKTDKAAWAGLASPVSIRFNEKAASAAPAPTARMPLQTSNAQSTASSTTAPSHSAFNPLHKAAPTFQARPLVGLPPAPTATNAGTRNLFMHFLGGAMKVPKIKPHS